MVAPRIGKYFHVPYVSDALDAMLGFAKKNNWPIADRAELYMIAQSAFGPQPNFDAFCEVNQWLRSYWKIGRGGEIWDSQQVFDALLEGCAASGRLSNLSLMSDGDGRSLATVKAVRAMAGVKKVGEYPHMAAAKYLHFFNPRLYPLYDNEVIWKRVLHGTFLSEWKEVCREAPIKVWEPSERFLITYYGWASDLMRTTEPKMMDIFASWFRAEAGTSLGSIEDDVSHYHVVAFEYILVGAALIYA